MNVCARYCGQMGVSVKIARIELGEIRIPLVTPFKTALRTVDSVNDIVVRITAAVGRPL